ncbi:c-type cytochrome domain-containing protein [Blastopirellula marina]|uniref:Cytochrome C Planctomycete-type domain-containing protein n=1 Tax=Blastopirellula marina TaxID=124 RepID=A0A2S8GI81_9BACT|nr:c-type cytochrome domain-containing protein [Blastopirellula marina]PQO44162.1 hypothetical protein C5Y93_19485 [Blastopirellula marina]
MSFRPTLSLLLLCLTLGRASAQEPAVSFRRDVAPILLDSCQACHGAKKAEGGYRVDTFEQLQKPGDSGETPIAAQPGEPSELLRRLTCEDEFERMPAESEPLAAAQIAVVEKWIAAGAKFDGDDPAQPLNLVIPPPTYAAPPQSYGRAVPITAVAFSPDGKLLIVGGYHELTLWDAATGALARRIPNVGQRTYAIDLAPGGETLAVACGEPGRSGEVRLIQLSTGEVQGVVSRSDDVVLDVAYRPGTTQLAAALTDGSIRIIDTATQQLVRTISSHADWVTAVSWSDDGKVLASGSLDKTAKAYDAETGEVLASFPGHNAAVRDVRILPGNDQAVSVGADARVRRWQLAEAKQTAEIGIGGEGRALLRSGDKLFVPCTDKLVRRIDLKENKVAQQYEGHADWLLTAALSPAAEQPSLATGDFAGEVRVWNAADGTLLKNWTAKP